MGWFRKTTNVIQANNKSYRATHVHTNLFQTILDGKFRLERYCVLYAMPSNKIRKIYAFSMGNWGPQKNG